MPNKYGHRTYNWFEAIVNKLGGEEAAEAFLRDELKLSVPVFKIRKTIRIGVHKTLPALSQMLSRFRVNDWAKDLLDKPAFTLAQTEEEVQLCLATVKELTGRDQATVQEIFNAIRRIGELCPAEVGPSLREQYLDQLGGELVYVAMETINDSHGNPCLFYLGRDHDDLWLFADWADPTRVYGGGRWFVFRPRK